MRDQAILDPRHVDPDTDSSDRGPNEPKGMRRTLLREPGDTGVHDRPFAGDPNGAKEGSLDENENAGGSEPTSDVGYFLALAARYPLLSAERERELGTSLWQARRRLAHALELAKRARGPGPLRVLTRNGYPNRPISPATRRRLMAVEEYSETLRSWVENGEPAKEGSRRSRRGKRARRPPMPALSLSQSRAIAPVLHQELDIIRSIREELVQHNLRLVVWVAKAYRGRGLDLVDLIQEGSMGLLRAIDRYDPAVGTRFSTFATHWVRQGIGRALAEKARLVRIPLNRLPEVREAMRAQSRLADSLQRTPTMGEIAAAMNMHLGKVHELLPALSPVDSIDSPLASGELSKADTLVDDRGLSPLEQAMEAETTHAVKKVLARMPERERVILAMRYGIGYPRECTLEEIGHKLGLSRERIRQIEQAARQQLRSLLASLKATPVNGN